MIIKNGKVIKEPCVVCGRKYKGKVCTNSKHSVDMLTNKKSISRREVEDVLYKPVFQDGKCPYCNSYKTTTRGKGNAVTQHIIHNHPEKYQTKVDQLLTLQEKEYHRGVADGMKLLNKHKETK